MTSADTARCASRITPSFWRRQPLAVWLTHEQRITCSPELLTGELQVADLIATEQGDAARRWHGERLNLGRPAQLALTIMRHVGRLLGQQPAPSDLSLGKTDQI
jgi:hypothetical protein